MSWRKKLLSRYLTFGAFILSAIGLILLAIFNATDFTVISLLMLITALVTVISTFLDEHIQPKLRMTFYMLGMVMVIISFVGFAISEEVLSVNTYCIFYGVIEAISGGVKVYEGIVIIKEKNKMGYLFVIDGLIEMVLGILMIIERQEGLRTHLILIAADKVYEGSIKLINTYVEDKKGFYEK